MVEFLLCSLVTLLPDYLFRRHVQGKRWGHELTLFSVWFELRWGLTLCAVLTISLVTMIFYYHPSTTNVQSYFRTVTILPESPGRVTAVHVANNDKVEAGRLLFELDDAAQRSAAETARRQVSEVDAAQAVAQSELAAAIGGVNQARSSLKQAEDELARNTELNARNPNVVAGRELERLANIVDARGGALEAALANRDAVQAKIDTLLPAQKASAEAALEQAEVALSKTKVYAGTDGTVEQFILQPGDYVSALLRPAGILVPSMSGRGRFQAGFDQISAQVLKVGMAAEITCISHPFEIVPMVIVGMQDVIAAGQIRPTDRLVDASDARAPGSITVFMEPMFEGGADAIPPGSRCAANAYTSFHDRLNDPELSTATFLFYHAVDATALVHAAILRIQALITPVQTLVLSGH